MQLPPAKPVPKSGCVFSSCMCTAPSCTHQESNHKCCPNYGLLTGKVDNCGRCILCLSCSQKSELHLSSGGIGGHSLGVMPACPSTTCCQASLTELQGKLCSLKQQPMKARPETDSKYLEAQLLGRAHSFGAEVWREKSVLEANSYSSSGKL